MGKPFSCGEHHPAHSCNDGSLTEAGKEVAVLHQRHLFGRAACDKIGESVCHQDRVVPEYSDTDYFFLDGLSVFFRPCVGQPRLREIDLVAHEAFRYSVREHDHTGKAGRWRAVAHGGAHVAKIRVGNVVASREVACVPCPCRMDGGALVEGEGIRCGCCRIQDIIAYGVGFGGIEVGRIEHELILPWPAVVLFVRYRLIPTIRLFAGIA